MSSGAARLRRLALPVFAAAVGVAVLLGELPDSRGPDGTAAPTPSLPEPARDATQADFCAAFRYFTAAHLDQLNNPDRPDATGLERAAATLLRTGVPTDASDAVVEGLLVVVDDVLAPYRTGTDVPEAAVAESPARNRRAGRFNGYAGRTCPDAF